MTPKPGYRLSVPLVELAKMMPRRLEQYFDSQGLPASARMFRAPKPGRRFTCEICSAERGETWIHEDLALNAVVSDRCDPELHATYYARFA